MDREYPTRPFVGIGVVAWRGDEVLLVKRARPPRLGQWGLPGGAQELGESIFAAAAREVLEETGVIIKPYAVITALDLIEPDEAGRVRFHYTLVEIAARYVSGAVTPGDDVSEARFVPHHTVAALAEWLEVARIVALAHTVR